MLTMPRSSQALRVSMEEQRQRQEEEARRAAAASAAEAGIAATGTEGERGGVLGPWGSRSVGAGVDIGVDVGSL